MRGGYSSATSSADFALRPYGDFSPITAGLLLVAAERLQATTSFIIPRHASATAVPLARRVCLCDRGELDMANLAFVLPNLLAPGFRGRGLRMDDLDFTLLQILQEDAS